MVQVGSFVMTKNTSEPRYHGYIHKARQGKARQGKARQGRAMQRNANAMRTQA
jgi:hypothetical protein